MILILVYSTKIPRRLSANPDKSTFWQNKRTSDLNTYSSYSMFCSPQKPYFIKVCGPVQNTFSVLTFRLKNSNQRLIFSFQLYTYLNAFYFKITNQLSIQNNPTRSAPLRNTSDYVYIIHHNLYFVKYYFAHTEIWVLIIFL